MTGQNIPGDTPHISPGIHQFWGKKSFCLLKKLLLVTLNRNETQLYGYSTFLLCYMPKITRPITVRAPILANLADGYDAFLFDVATFYTVPLGQGMADLAVEPGTTRFRLPLLRFVLIQ